MSTEDRCAYDPFAPAPIGAAHTEPGNEPGTSEPATPDSLDDMSRADLITVAEQRGVPTYGSKAAITARLRAAMNS